MQIVILGNGVAGMEAALTVREREPTAVVTIISEESDHFFSRTALMWVACGQLSHRDIEPLERDAYERLDLRRVRARAVGIDVQARRVKLASGQDVGYDRLLIACGSAPRPAPWPGAEARGVGHFVTHQDLAWLERELYGAPAHEGPPRAEAHVGGSCEDSPYRFREVAAERRGGRARQPAIIGGGLIGIEAVEVCVAAGLSPHFFIREEWFWPMAIDARESAWITERMREHGVQVHLEHDVEELLADEGGNLRGVRTNQGEFAADCCVVAIGVVPNTRWLEGSEVELSRGAIVVDDGLATSAQGIFAAGDCAAVRWFDGQKRPEQLWYTARDQGRVAGSRLVGGPGQYDRGIWYNSAKLMDIEYTTCGLVNMNVQEEGNWFYEERGSVRSTTRIVTQGERVIGFNLLGRRWDHSVLNRFIHERRSLRWVLEHLGEAAFDTEFVPPLRIPESERRRDPEGPAPSAITDPQPFPESW